MAFKAWSTQEKLLSVDLNANFALAADLASTQTFTGAKTFTGNVTLGVDGTGVDLLAYGDSAGAFMEWDQSEDTLTIQGATAAGAGTLDLNTGELTVVDGDVLGRIDFAAPLESSGTDAVLVAASIWAEADATFDATTNTTNLVFASATSETATGVMQMAKASLSPVTTDGMSLGTSTLNWSDLFLASGAVINFDSGDVTLTHSANTLTVAGGTFATAALTATTITGSGILSIDDTTDSTSTTTGSIHTDGGVGIAKDLILGATSTIFVGDTANGSMTAGVTINQGTADDEALALKSSDITGGTIFGETDTYFSLQKNTGTGGGTKIQSKTDANSGSGDTALAIWSFADDAFTEASKGTTSRGIIEYLASQHDSAGSAANVVANGNCHVFRARKGGADTTVFLVDEDGDYHYDGADGTAFDLWEDAPLLRTAAIATSDPRTIVRSKWDEMVKYDERHLVETGLVGYCSPEDKAKGARGLVNGAGIQRALVGEAWQGYCRDMELMERCNQLESQNALLEARLNLLEN